MELKGVGSGWGKTAGAFALAAILVVSLYWLLEVMLLVFLSVLLGILLDTITSFWVRFLKFRRGAAVVLSACLFVLGVLAALGLIMVPLIKEGVDFAQSLPSRVSKVEQWIDQYKQENPWIGRFLPPATNRSEPGERSPVSSAPTAPELAQKAFFTVSTAVEWGATALAVFFLGLFWAWDPERWLKGVALLFGEQGVEERIALGRRLAGALRSYLFSMAVYILAMGGAWSLGLWLIGIDYALLFGAIGGLAEVVPYMGPMVAVVPPFLFALTQGVAKTLYVLGLYVLLHILEGYVLVPFLMHEREHLPPPVVVISILVCGAIFGPFGVILAVPLGTVAYVLSNELVSARRTAKGTRGGLVLS